MSRKAETAKIQGGKALTTAPQTHPSTNPPTRFTRHAPRSPRPYYQGQQRRGAEAPRYPLRENHEHGPDPPRWAALRTSTKRPQGRLTFFNRQGYSTGPVASLPARIGDHTRAMSVVYAKTI